MIITTLIYTSLETFLKLIENAVVWVAKSILDGSITTFQDNQNIFQTFINLIPFSGSIHLGPIIKGISYGLVVLLMIISILKSMSSPFTGNDAENPAQSVVRAAVAIVLITAIFGTSFSGGNGSVQFSGLLDLIGRWFGTILSKIGRMPDTGSFRFSFHANPAEYIGVILLEFSLLATIVTAALQYVERIICFALYIVLGPVATAMYTSRNTESIFKDWLTGIISQFMSLFVSLIMWAAFIESAKSNSDTLLHYAIMLAILGVMRNSEKILDLMGFKTMRLGDSARAAVAGAALFMTSVSTATNLRRMHGTGSKPAGNSMDVAPGTTGAFAADGSLRSAASMKASQSWQVANSWKPITAIRNANAQNRAMSSMQSAMQNQTAISAATLNTALGYNSSSRVHALGNGSQAMMQPAMVTSADGKTVSGFVGDAAINRNGQVETSRNAFFAIHDGSSVEGLAPGSTVDVPVWNVSETSAAVPYAPEGYSGNLYITENSIGTQLGSVYATSFNDPNLKFADIKSYENQVQEESITGGPAGKTEEPTVKIVSEKVHEPRNV